MYYIAENSYYNSWQGKLYQSNIMRIISLIWIAAALYSILYIYMFPSILAYKKNNTRLNQIIIINIFLGATVIGWVAALVISVDKKLANGGGDKNIENKLGEIKLLLENKIITQEEYELKRKEILSRI